MKLHGYFRSAAAYRVRIALNLKGLAAEHLPRHLRKGEQCVAGDCHRESAHLGAAQRIFPAAAADRDRPRPAIRVHPVQNLKVLNRLRQLGLPEEKVTEWAAWANREGLSACEALVKDEKGPFCFGDTPSMADLCLVPQLGNARRFGVDVSVFPRLLKAEAAAKAMKAFADAAPDRQADAE